MANKIEPYKGIAVTYDEIRPSYPQKLIDDIISKTNLKLEDRLLEIGAGTGKATVQFAEKGFTIDAIELGKDMADILKDKCKNYTSVSVDVTSFEKWNCPLNQKYDMIYSAQAFHWMDPSIKYAKCHELLKDNGYLVLFWYQPSNDKLPVTKEIEEKVDIIIKKYASNYYTDKGQPERRAHDGVYGEDKREAEIKKSGLFELIEKIEYVQETKNNPIEYLKAMKSVPSFASVLDGLDDNIIKNMDNEITEVINNYGGYVGSLLNFSLYIAKRI